MADGTESDVELDGAECQRRSEEFAEKTGTDTALAMFFLQDCSWDLDAALSQFHASKGEFADNKDDVIILDSDSDEETASAQVEVAADDSIIECGTSTMTNGRPQHQPQRVRIGSWNVDGLDMTRENSRHPAFVAEIKERDFDVVFIQELSYSLETFITNNLPTYKLIVETSQTCDYFVGMLLKNMTCRMVKATFKPFRSSMMGRGILKVDAKIHDQSFSLLCCHAESCAEHAEERVKQSASLFKMAHAEPPGTAVIAGGDMNAREKELNTIRDKLPDLWELTGSRKECRFTWDMWRNTNKAGDFHGNFKPKARFDRLFYRPPDGWKLNPVYFELFGIQHVPQTKYFVSDHWGIMTHFDMTV